METNCRLSDTTTVLQGALATKVLTTAVELDLFTRIARGARTPEAISEEAGINLALLDRLLKACASLGLMKAGRAGYSNSVSSTRYLSKESDYYIGDFVILVGKDYYDVWRSLSDVVATGKPIREDRTVRLSDPRYGERYIKAMHGISVCHASEIANKLSLKGRKSMLEVGGAHGTYSVLMAKKHPGMMATVFDSPFACRFAEKHATEQGTRVRCEGGDFVLGNLPKGHDVVMLTHVLQDLPPQKCEALLRKAYDSLPKGGLLMINEFRLEKDGMTPAFSSLFSLNALMLSDGGTLYPYSEIMEWAGNIGFRDIKVLKSGCELIVTLTALK